MSGSEICFSSATELARRIRSKDLSARDLMATHLARIARLNPKLNAIVTLVPEQAMEQAKEADEALAKHKEAGPLHGLPVAHKDLFPTQGIRTTYGSLVFKDLIPDHDALIVERFKKSGAITVGKTNTPELGAGSQTYNEIFGDAQPYDTTKTCGGSSGGAAVARTGMLPLRTGATSGPCESGNFAMGGFRPFFGSSWPTLHGSPFRSGPMARTVRTWPTSIAIAGPDPRSPITLLAELLLGQRDFKGVRVAWSRNLGGLPVDPAVTAVIEGKRGVFESFGCLIEDTEPDFTGADEIFKAMRAWRFELGYGHLLKDHRDKLKSTVVWNIEEGNKLTGPDLGLAERKRTELYHRVRQFMETYEFLILPVNQVLPFDLKQRYVTEINGVKMDTYIDWMKSCYYISVIGHPAISVPCGFTPDGLPVGLQIVGRHRDDFGVLQLAHAFEQATELWKRRPPGAD
jgi:amidase